MYTSILIPSCKLVPFCTTVANVPGDSLYKSYVITLQIQIGVVPKKTRGVVNVDTANHVWRKYPSPMLYDLMQLIHPRS